MLPPSQRPKGRDGVLSTLNVAIDVLNLAKDFSGVLPAKAAFGSVGILLTMIRVSPFSFCAGWFLDHVSIGLHDQRTGLRRARAELRRYLQSA